MVYINGNRNGYNEQQCGETMTVSELIEMLSEFGEDEKVYLCNDRGYTFGSINSYDISENKENLA